MSYRASNSVILMFACFLGDDHLLYKVGSLHQDHMLITINILRILLLLGRDYDEGSPPCYRK